MSEQLAVLSPLSTSAQAVQDANGNASPLLLGTTSVRIVTGGSSPPFDGPFLVSGAEITPNGLSASVTINNAVQEGGANWYLRAGARGTNTPIGGFSIANDNTYAISITSTGQVGIINNTPQATLDVNGTLNVGPISSDTPPSTTLNVNGTANVSGKLQCGSLSVKLTPPPSTVQVTNLRVVVVDVSTGTLYYV